MDRSRRFGSFGHRLFLRANFPHCERLSCHEGRGSGRGRPRLILSAFADPYLQAVHVSSPRFPPSGPCGARKAAGAARDDLHCYGAIRWKSGPAPISSSRSCRAARRWASEPSSTSLRRSSACCSTTPRTTARTRCSFACCDPASAMGCSPSKARHGGRNAGFSPRCSRRAKSPASRPPCTGSPRRRRAIATKGGRRDARGRRRDGAHHASGARGNAVQPRSWARHGGIPARRDALFRNYRPARSARPSRRAKIPAAPRAVAGPRAARLLRCGRQRHPGRAQKTHQLPAPRRRRICSLCS